MSEKPSRIFRDIFLAALAMALVLAVHGAVPFVTTPTLGQAVWTMGFSQSFANGPLFGMYAHDFGIPKPAAIAFGLAGAWPASLLLRLGWHAADAYAGMMALWLSLALFCAYRIGCRLGLARPLALLGGVAWMTMPITWAHAGYSMVSLGIALLSFYFLAAFRLFLVGSETPRIAPATIALYCSAAIVSVFMDGYTFMMFASGASILLLYSLYARPLLRPVLMRLAMPVHVVSFALAYCLYSAYIGKSNFEAHSIDFFRGWGLDLSFIAIPTKGMFWLPDLLGFSLKRTNALYFGDGSVWESTFSLPVLCFGLLAWWQAKDRMKMSTGILLLAIAGFYMALGPSLKINAIKPESLQLSRAREQSAVMPAELALAPTGNAWISKTLPGFNVMRASYRWSALGIFALWLLIMIWLSRTDKKHKPILLLALLAVIVLNLPDLQKRWQAGTDDRAMLQLLERDLVAELGRYVHRDETVAFIPWRNDFMANYLAPKIGFRTFNIGGDKNLAIAQSQWPSAMLALGAELDTGKTEAAVKMLIDGTADVLVLPYIHMLWSPHLWPCPDQSLATLNDEQREFFHSIPGFLCPAEQRAALQSFVLALRKSPYVEVAESPLFATARLRPQFSGPANRAALLSTIWGPVEYPIAVGEGFRQSPYVLRDGWHALEAHQVWSQGAAKLMLPAPPNCDAKACNAILKFTVFGATPQHRVAVEFASAEQGWHWSKKIFANSSELIEVMVPLAGAKGGRELAVTIPEASSPQALNISSDARVLGIALQRIDLAF